MTDIEIDFVEPGQGPGATRTERPTEGTCTECGTTFEISNRGRVPTKCPQHRKNAPATGTGRKRGRRKVRREASDYARMAFEAIAGYITTPLIVGGLGIKHPGIAATGFAIAYQSAPRVMDETSGEILEHGPIPDALGQIAAEELKLAEVLERISVAGPWVKLGMALAPILPQLIVNTGFVGPGFAGTADPEQLRQMAGAQLANMVGGMVIPFSQMVSEDGPTPNGNGQHE